MSLIPANIAFRLVEGSLPWEQSTQLGDEGLSATLHASRFLLDRTLYRVRLGRFVDPRDPLRPCLERNRQPAYIYRSELASTISST